MVKPVPCSPVILEPLNNIITQVGHKISHVKSVIANYDGLGVKSSNKHRQDWELQQSLLERTLDVLEDVRTEFLEKEDHHE